MWDHRIADTAPLYNAVDIDCIGLDLAQCSNPFQITMPCALWLQTSALIVCELSYL